MNQEERLIADALFGTVDQRTRAEYDKIDLLQDAAAHRGEGFLLQTLEKHGNGPRTLLTSLRQRLSAHEDRYDRYTNELLKFARSSSLDVLLIKGPTGHILYEDTIPPRYIDDMDVLTRDWAHLLSGAVSRGYRSKKREAVHEYAEVTNGRVAFDFHRYFPVWQSPVRIGRPYSLRKDLLAYFGHRLFIGSARQVELGIDSLLSGARPFDLAAKNVKIVDPTQAALIAGAHVIKDLMHAGSYSMRFRPALRFGDLREAVLLSRRSGPSTDLGHAVAEFVDGLAGVIGGTRGSIEIPSNLIGPFWYQRSVRKGSLHGERTLLETLMRELDQAVELPAVRYEGLFDLSPHLITDSEEGMPGVQILARRSESSRGESAIEVLLRIPQGSSVQRVRLDFGGRAVVEAARITHKLVHTRGIGEICETDSGARLVVGGEAVGLTQPYEPHTLVAIFLSLQRGEYHQNAIAFLRIDRGGYLLWE